jgi:hypothetical protein
METITQFITDNWPTITTALAAFIATFLIPGARQIWPIIFRALVTRRAVIQAILYLVDPIIKSSKSKLDDTLWAPVKKALMDELAK